MRSSRSQRTARAFIALLPITAVVWLAASCDQGSSVVGGVCAPGYTDCNDECIETSHDPNNCGGCGIVCSSGSCVDGVCERLSDAAVDGMDAAARADARRDGETRDVIAETDGHRHDGTLEDGAVDGVADVHARDGSHDALHDDAPVSDATRPDGHSPDAHPADAMARDGSSDAHEHLDAGVDQCAPPFDTVSSCGTCGTMCAADKVCSPSLDAGADGGAYSCVDLCTAPLVDCSGTCVLLDSDDPNNCGACGNQCLSGICQMGVCTGSTAGDIVVIGHDYATANVRASEAKLLSNAVFLPPRNPLRVLSFEEYAVASQVTNVKSSLAEAATVSGRTMNLTVVSDYTLIPSDLASGSYDVLLVYDQAAAPAGTLQPIGAAWQMSLAQFLSGGGDVVVLDGASGAHPQMATLLSTAGLLQTSGETAVAPATQLFVVASLDAVGHSVESPYATQADTVSFVTSEANGGNVVYVVEVGPTGPAPVVIHKVPP